MFMVSVPSAHSGVWVDLPHVKNVTAQPGANRDDVLRVVVSRDGNTYFRRSKIEVSELHNRLREEIQNGSEPKVYLYVDARARNGDVEPAVDQIQLAGIVNIAIIASGPSGSPVSLTPKIPFLYPFYFPDMREIPVRRLSRAYRR
jgi:biopolymer transport protein ExbD